MKLYYKGQVYKAYVVEANTYIKRLRGLMFKRHAPDYVLVIHPCASIHTYFMNFDIDVLFLDQDCRVLKKCSGLKKRQIIMPVKASKYVLETHKGGFDAITVGDRLSMC